MVFEIPPNQRTFYVSPEDLSQTRANLKIDCFFCPNPNFAPADLGCIAGEQQANGIWFVYGKVNFPYSDGNEEVKFEARFDEVENAASSPVSQSNIYLQASRF